MKVSILTSCYNKESFISKCIRSVLSQKYNDLEHIIIDDCSQDDSRSIIDSYRHDPRIKVIYPNHQKFCSSSYAEALRHVTGDICGILDGDDVLEDNAIQIIVDKYQKYPHIDFIYTQHHWYDKKDRRIKKGLSSMPIDGKSLAESVLAGRHCFSHWRTFRSKLAKKCVIFPENLRYAVDKNMGFVLEENGRGAFLDLVLYRYRYYKGNMSLTNAKDQKITAADRAKAVLEKRVKAFPIEKIK